MRDAVGEPLEPGDWVAFVSGADDTRQGRGGMSLSFGRVVLATKKYLVVDSPRKPRMVGQQPPLVLYRNNRAPGKVIKVPRIPTWLMWLWEKP